MGVFSWPSDSELDKIRNLVAEMAGVSVNLVKIVVSPYRICPLGAHIDHQGGIVSAMTIDKGIILGFVPSGDSQVLLRSGQFSGEVRFRVDQIQLPKHIAKSNGKIQENDPSESMEECKWGVYAKGASYALQRGGNDLKQGFTGFICGTNGLDSSGLSSSAAVGIAYLLALESANDLIVSPTENIEYDRIIENEYLGLKNGILDQSAILLSSYGCLTCMDCKTKIHKIIHPPTFTIEKNIEAKIPYKILLAFSGLKEALITNPGYNRRVTECREAAKIILKAAGKEVEPILCNVEHEEYEAHKSRLKPDLAKRAEHYFSENARVIKGLEAWGCGNFEEFGKLMSASGLSSIQNYECGCEPLIQLYDILLKAPGVYGARFSGAGFRGCCVAFVNAGYANEAASFVKTEYSKLQPNLASHLSQETAVVICDSGDCARVI